jgi:hypothetical protein
MSTRTIKALSRMRAQEFPAPDLVRDLSTRTVLDGHIEPMPPVERRLAAPVRSLRRLAWATSGLVAAAIVGLALLVPTLTLGHTTDVPTATMLSYQPITTKESIVTLLTDLAADAAHQPGPSGTGLYHFVHTRGWYLSTSSTTDGHEYNARVEPVDRQQWIAANGSGRLLVTGSGAIQTPPSGDYAAGVLHTNFLTANSTASLRAELNEDHRSSGTADAWLGIIKDTWNGQVVPPALQAAMLEGLAQQRGVVVEGLTTDRAGRTGIAISATDSRPGTPAARYVLILDPHTGMALDYEEIALAAGGRPIQVPATVGYTVWLSSGYTNSVSEQPRAK